MARPFSDDWQFKLGHRPRPSSEQTVPAHPLPNAAQSSANRPFSDSAKYSSKEAEVIDTWFEDLDNYEKTLEQMSVMRLDENMKQELRAVNGWFLNQNECERTTILYTLIRHCSQLQVRFFLMVLQQMAMKDPIASLLSPRTSVTEMIKTHPQIYGSQLDEKDLEASERLLRILPPLRDHDIPSDGSDSGSTSRLYNRHAPQYKKETNSEDRSSYTLSNRQVPTEPLKPHRPVPPVPYHVTHPKDTKSPLTNTPPPLPTTPAPTTIPIITSSAPSSTPTSPLVSTPPQIAGNQPILTNVNSPSAPTSTPLSSKPQVPPRSYYNTQPTGIGTPMDIPTWLKSLRLHKYTSIFENMEWDKLVKLTDEELESLGMAALGARRKILREFEILQEEGYPPLQKE